MANAESTTPELIALQEAFEMDPGNFKSCNNLGDYHFRRGDFEKAIEYFERTVQLNAEEPVAFVNLALAYRHTRRFPQALEALRRALVLESLNPWARYQLALTYLDRGLYSESLLDLEKAYEVFDSLRELAEDGMISFDAREYQLEKMIRMVGTFIQMNQNLEELKDYLIESTACFGEQGDTEIPDHIIN
jgi:tetratricopeptide (TPR) repeat protein